MTRPEIRRYPIGMWKILISILIAGTTAQAAARKNKDILREAIEAAPAVKDSYSIQKTKSGVRYFVGTFGACQCANDNLIANCVKDLPESLKTQLKVSQEQSKIECHPLAGCTMGIRGVFVECPTTGESLTNY